MTRNRTDANGMPTIAVSFGSSVDVVFSAGAMFTARGFSYSTIRTLAIAGIDAPERLLFATETDLRSIAGIDEKAFQEIAGYRCRFVSADYWPPFEAPSPVSLDALRQAIIIPHGPDRVIP